MATIKKKKSPTSKAPEGSQSIRRAIEVMRYVASGRENGRRLTDVASNLELNVTTAHRMLGTLVYSGLLLQRSDTKSYILGPELISLAATAQSQLTYRNLFLPAMTRIAKETGDTVFLQIRSGDETVCLARETGAFTIPALVLNVGTRLPLGVGSAGIAMLTFMSPTDCEAAMAHCLPEYKKLGVRLEAIRQSVKASRRLGYAFQEGQMTPEVSGVGVLLLKDGEIGVAISVTALRQRMDAKRRKQIVSVIRSACSNIPGFSLFPPEPTGRLSS